MVTTKDVLIDLIKSVHLIPLLLITACFVLWGFTNDITGVTTNAFTQIFQLNATEGGFINIANALGYFTLSIPAAVFMTKYTYKAGVLFSLGVYAVGILMLLPAKIYGEFYGFLVAYFVMTCGSAALETCCHPMVYRMGNEERGILRLNFAQAFNSVGGALGMYIAINYIQKGFSTMPIEQRLQLPKIQAEVLKSHELEIITQPYLYIAAAIILLMVLIRITQMPTDSKEEDSKGIMASFAELLRMKNYRNGLLAEFFYVGGQICCLTFIIIYARETFSLEEIYEADIDPLVNKYNMAAIIMFAVMRFVCTPILLYIKPGRLLIIMGVVATMSLVGAVLFQDRNGIYCIVLTCAAMSIMYPTIFGMALRGIGNNIKYASAGLTMTVFAGAVFPTLQAAIIDMKVTILGLSAVHLSFIVPLVCFIVVTIYGHTGYVRHNITHDYVS